MVSLVGDTDIRVHNLAQETVIVIFPHFHLHGSGAWFRHRSEMLDPAALQVLIAKAITQALVAAATHNGACGSNGSGGQIHKHYTRLDKLVPEEWKEWQYQFSVATHAYNAKNGVLLEIVERMELDEITTESLEHEMSQEESEWMRRSQSEMAC